MKWRKRSYFEILAPRSSLRQRVAYSLVIVRLILVPVIFLAVYYLFEMGWIVDRIVNIDAPATQMAEQASIQMSEARRAERNYFLLHDTGSLRINQEALTNVRQTLNTVADLEPGEKPTTQAGLDAVNIYQQRFSAAVSQLTQPGQTPPARIQQVMKAYETDLNDLLKSSRLSFRNNGESCCIRGYDRIAILRSFLPALNLYSKISIAGQHRSLST